MNLGGTVLIILRCHLKTPIFDIVNRVVFVSHQNLLPFEILLDHTLVKHLKKLTFSKKMRHEQVFETYFGK